jgi:hypothetical protein
MIPVSSPVNSTYLHGIQADRSVLEISTILAGSPLNITAGQPVTLDVSGTADQGKIVLVQGNVKVLGLAKSNKNQYIDETLGYTGIQGSGKMATQCKGIVTVRPSIFLDSSTGNTITVSIWDGTIVAGLNPMTKLYATAAGLISTNYMSNTYIGQVLHAPTASSFALQILLDC